MSHRRPPTLTLDLAPAETHPDDQRRVGPRAE